jgi:hypothetical protein
MSIRDWWIGRKDIVIMKVIGMSGQVEGEISKKLNVRRWKGEVCRQLGYRTVRSEKNGRAERERTSQSEKVLRVDRLKAEVSWPSRATRGRYPF